MELTRQNNNSQLAGYADDELLELMSMKDDRQSAEQAFNEFYRRFKDLTFKAIHMICATYTNQEELTRIVFNNTFLNAYLYSHSFSSRGETKQEAISKKISGWLFTIAKNELKAVFSKETRDAKKDEELYTAMLKNARKKASGSYNEEIVKKAMERIPNERDREIFYIYWLYYEETEGGQARKLPPDIVQGWCDKYNTTEPNIRQIISRSRKIVSEYLLQHYKK